MGQVRFTGHSRLARGIGKVSPSAFDPIAQHAAAVETELALLPTFEVFARVLSFAKTAHMVDLTRATVHHRISTLQELVGKPLYRRTRGTMSLTDQGNELARFARELLHRRTDFLRRVVRPTRARLVCEPALLAFLMQPVIERYLREGHGELEVSCADADGAVRAVAEDRADLAIVRGALRPALPGRILLRAPFVVAAPPEHEVHRNRSLARADLDEHHVIEHPTAEASLACVAAGLGVAIVPSYQAIPPTLRTRVVRDLPRAVVRLVHSRDVRVLHAPFELRRILFEHFDR
jgi:DNA-binding transcriptional LysR family regulator